jgi:hypothetical protein
MSHAESVRLPIFGREIGKRLGQSDGVTACLDAHNEYMLMVTAERCAVLLRMQSPSR